MALKTAAKKNEEVKKIDIQPLKKASVHVCLLGVTPLIYNRVNEKAKRELLFPAGRRRNKADRAGSLKHVPIEEYRGSVYQYREGERDADGRDYPTRLYFPGAGPKAAMCSAALRLPGVTKTEIGALVSVKDLRVPVFGIPSMYMAIVRSGDIAHTPDVRTRAIVERWAAIVTVHYVTPLLNEAAVLNLLSAAGMIAGLGDGRQEKGKLDFGQFDVVDKTHPAFREILKNGGRKAQDKALGEVDFYDEDSKELSLWFDTEYEERDQRGLVPVITEAPPTENVH